MIDNKVPNLKVIAKVRKYDKNNSVSTHYIAEVLLKGVTATFTNVMESVLTTKELEEHR